MKISEQNKLIAEFMGLSLYRGKWVKSNIATTVTVCKENGLKYNDSWDWLMPVVEKIENEHNMVVNISRGSVGIIHNSQPIYAPGHVVEKTKIKAVYNTVIKFIVWYNQQ